MNNSTPKGCTLMIPVSNRANDVILTIIYSLISLFIVTSNITLMVGLPKVKKKLTRYDRMFILLLSCDLMVGLIQMPYQIYLIHQFGVVTCIQVGIKTMLSVLLAMISGLLTFAIANDRYIFLTRERFHERFLNPICTVFIIIVMFMIAIGWTATGVYVSIQGEHFARILCSLITLRTVNTQKLSSRKNVCN